MRRAGAGPGIEMPGPGHSLEIGEEGELCAAPTLASVTSPLAGHEPRLGAAAAWHGRVPTYAALDLGTNNCRLLIARPTANQAAGGFKIIDSFSRIVRLGEGLSQTGQLSEAAMERTLQALAVCKNKMQARRVTQARLIATEACRAARNGHEFVTRVREALGLTLEIVGRETEAHLAATGCASLADARATSVLLFDIGGGSSEVIWLDRCGADREEATERCLRERIRFWASLKLGVVTLAEKFGGIEVSDAAFESMINCVSRELDGFAAVAGRLGRCSRFHLLGTSGTITTIAGVFLNLSRYDRRRVDGLWMSEAEVSRTVARLLAMSYRERVANGCIGPERADLVLAGCAILEAIRRAFPAERVRIADRGLREGILQQLIEADRMNGARL